jgi:hypothetical protein
MTGNRPLTAKHTECYVPNAAKEVSAAGDRRLVGVGVALAVVCALLLVAPPAYATDYCGSNGDHGIWLRNSTTTSYGTQAQVIAVNHSLVNCGGFGYTTVSVNTVGNFLSTDAKNWVEMGYEKYLYCSIGCSTTYRMFGEWGFYPNSQNNNYSLITAGTVPRFKLNFINGSSNNWHLWWDSSGGTNYTSVDTYTNMYASHGYSYGEASRTGKTGTDIIDHHYDLKQNNSPSGNWVYFSSLACWNDTDADYQWQKPALQHEFQVVSGGNYC